MDENRYQWFFNYFLKMSGDFYNHIFLISYVFTATPWLVSDSINEMQSSVSVYYWFNFTRNPNNTTAAHWFYKSWKNISTYRVSQKIFVRLILFSDLLLEIYREEWKQDNVIYLYYKLLSTKVVKKQKNWFSNFHSLYTS